MKVLETDHPLSNAEVLHWINQKNAQHEHEDSKDTATGNSYASRPKNFLDSLEKHRQHLTLDAYPYAKNPSAYEGTNQDASIRRFGELHFAKIQEPLVEKYKEEIRKGGMKPAQAQKELAAKQEQKELTEAEILMIHNHAPMVYDVLQCMVEDMDARFTTEEQTALLECVQEAFRPDEQLVQNGMEVEPVLAAEVDNEA